MGKRTHYQVLGVELKSDEATIRSAYRKLVLKHHPDRSNNPNSAQIFMEIAEAYEILRDPIKRRAYNDSLAPKPRPVTVPPKKTAQPKPVETPVAADVAKLAATFSRGRFKEAESLARRILIKDAKQALPYAVLGDIMRSKGELIEAGRLYALAVQMDPMNASYLRKHEEVSVVVRDASSSGAERGMATGIGFGLVVCAGAYLALSKEPAIWPQLSLVSTWTIGLVVMLFLSGAAVGAALSLGRVVDRFSGVSSGPVALGTISLVNFWAAVVLYLVLGYTQNAFSVSTTRLICAVAGIVITLAASAGIAGHIEPAQVILWGGNLAYLGAICGWMATDSLRG